MKIAVVYESMFGNTAQVARAVADGMRIGGTEPEVMPVEDAGMETLETYDVVAIGAPTHAFSLSRPSTRQDAARRGAAVNAEQAGMREWLARMPEHPRAAVAAFDTRARNMRHWPGSAARRMTRTLRRGHVTVIGRPTSFYVTGLTGPLAEGEEQRARDWGADLMRQMEKSL